MNFIGMDIHKKATVAVVKDEQGNLIKEAKFENSKENFQEFLNQFPKEQTKIVMESTCVWEYIFDLIDEFGYSVKLSNPVKTKAIACARIKTDSVYANTLCDLLRANLIAESYIPTKEVRKLREIVRERKTFVQQTVQLKNKIQSLLIKRGIKLPTITLCKEAIRFLLETFDSSDIIIHYVNLLNNHEEELEIMEEKIKDLARAYDEAVLLMTIPGVAEIRALEIYSEIGEIKRFESSGKLCSYAGLVPSVRQSGESLKFGRLVQQSSKILKHALVEASWNIVRSKQPNELQIFFKRLSKKKGKQKAICAVARKTCSIIHSMLRKNQKYEAFYDPMINRKGDSRVSAIVP